MRAGAKIVLSVVALLGVASAVLGFIAEATRLKPDDIGVNSRGCVYPGNPAFLLALCAAFLLLVAQIVASAAGGCCGCCRPGMTGGVRAPKCKRLLGILASVLSWIAALIALVFYLDAAVLNVPNTLGSGDRRCGDGCYYLKGGVLGGAAVLSLVATALGIASFVMLTSAPAATAAGYVPKPDGQYPTAVGMQQYPGQGPPDSQFAPRPPGQGPAYASL